jgi:hypothetical protein
MNPNGLAKHYPQLTALERFKLVVAAEGRGDDAETDRLINSAEKLSLVASDCLPYWNAWHMLAVLIFVEVTDAAASYHDAAKACDLPYMSDTKKKDRRTIGRRLLQARLAIGFVLRTKTDGWKLFCERHGLPPFRVWERMPGYVRLHQALELVEGNADGPGAAFTREEVLAWMNRKRPDGKPELTEAEIVSAESYAEQIDHLFLNSARWFGAGV